MSGPDVTPKTESLLDRWIATGAWPPDPEPPGGWTPPRLYEAIAAEVRSEAASKAVAEERNAILDEVMEAIAAVPTFGEDRLLLYRSQVLNRLTEIRALIASERPSEKETRR